MNDDLKKQLVSSMLRFKKVGMSFPEKLNIHMGEAVVMFATAENSSKSAENVFASDIQEKLHITKSAISQILKSLQKKGYLERSIDNLDRRKILITLTPKGETVLAEMKLHFDNTLSEIIDSFGQEKTKELIRLFSEFADISDNYKTENNDLKKGDVSLG